MAVLRATPGKSYIRLLPLVSAVVLLGALAVPAVSHAQDGADRIRLDETNDRQDAELQRVIQEQELEKDLNDAETERSLRQSQDEIDQRLREQEAETQADAERRAAQDRADYLRNAESARAAAIAKQAHDNAKKTQSGQNAPTPGTPGELRDDAADNILGAPSMAGARPQARPAPEADASADSILGAPATRAMTAEEQAIDAAVAEAVAKVKAGTEGAPAAATVAPMKDAPVPVPAPSAQEQAKGGKTTPPPLNTAAKAMAKTDQALNDELNGYDADVMDEVMEGMPARRVNDLALEEDKDTPSLSLNSIVMFALDDNPDIGMAKARKQQAIHNVGRAKAALYPKIDMTMEQSLEYNNPAAGKNPPGANINPSDRVSMTLQQLIYDGDITSNTIKQREQAVTGTDFEIAANTKDVLGTTVQQYLNVLKFQSTLRDNQEFIARLKNIEEIIQTTYQMGGSAKNDVEYAESRMAAAESGLENVRSSLNDAVSNLQSLTGPLPEFVAMQPTELDPERVKLDEYVKLAQQFNNDVLANENDLKSLKYKLKSDKGAFMPRVNVIMMGERTYDDGGPIGRDVNGKATVQLSYNIFDGFEKKENIKRTQAMISEIEIKRRKIADDLKKQLRLSYNQMISLQKNISKTKAEISSSQALQDLNRQNFEQGTTSLIELIEGEERLNNAKAKLHQQESDLFLSAYKLLLQVGIMKKNFFCTQC